MNLLINTRNDRIEFARRIARDIHQNQFDKRGYPYICHVIDVAKRVAHMGEDFEIVGLLHDVVEDAPYNRQASLLEEIQSNFGAAVYDGVIKITNRTATNREKYYSEYLPQVIANPLSKAVKIADAAHNLSKVHLIEDQIEQDRLRKKYSEALEFLGEDPLVLERPIVFVEEEGLGGWVEETSKSM